MKVTSLEEIESRTAFNRHMYCYKCGSHIYNIHHQLEPKTDKSWWIECDGCGFESPGFAARKTAIDWWKW